MQPVGILFLIDALHTGGTERQLLELAQNLDPRRFRAHLGVLREDGGELGKKSGLPLAGFQFQSFQQISTFGCLWRLGAYIRHHHIRMVQCFFQDPMLVAACSRLLHGARLVGSFRDMGFWRSPRESLKMRLAYPAFSCFIANSDAVKTHFVQVDGISPERVAVIHNGIDLDEVPCCTSMVIKTPPVVGIVANLNRPVKRVHDFISAAALIHQKQPDVRFVVVGGGHLLQDLESQVKAAGLGNVLEFTGLVARPMEQIQRFSVGVITSETEGFCNAIIEYMACGVPVVATDVGGNPELVRSGVNGFLVPVAGVEQMAERILQLLSDEVLCARIAEENRQTVRRQFAMPTMVSRYEELYSRLLAGERP